MIYVALLRGINVGGNNKISMQRLKAVFERAGMQSVTTFINSGNVIFSDTSHTAQHITDLLETAIEKEFGFHIKVLLRDIHNLKKVIGELPQEWKNDTATKCDVMFLWEKVDTPTLMNELIIKPDIDDVRYVAGTILWRVDKKLVTRSGLLRIVGTPLYKHMTIRNCNTARKLLEHMEALEATTSKR